MDLEPNSHEEACTVDVMGDSLGGSCKEPLGGWWVLSWAKRVVGIFSDVRTCRLRTAYVLGQTAVGYKLYTVSYIPFRIPGINRVHT